TIVLGNAAHAASQQQALRRQRNRLKLRLATGKQAQQTGAEITLGSPVSGPGLIDGGVVVCHPLTLAGANHLPKSPSSSGSDGQRAEWACGIIAGLRMSSEQASSAERTTRVRQRMLWGLPIVSSLQMAIAIGAIHFFPDVDSRYWI